MWTWRIPRVTFSATCHAQVITDSLANDFRTSMAKNFSQFRTVNLYWETKMAHDYNFSLNGNEVEKMRKKNLHTFRASTMIPMLKLRHVSLYAHLQYNRYLFDTYEKQTGRQSDVFRQSAYDYYVGGLNGSYYFSLFNKPMIVSTTVSVDGWDKGFGMVYGTLSAVMLLKNTERTSFSLGVMGRTLFSSMPVMPVVTWWHRFNNPPPERGHHYAEPVLFALRVGQATYLRRSVHDQREFLREDLLGGCAYHVLLFRCRTETRNTLRIHFQ